MPINKLDHVNIRTTQLETMIEWYTSVLGLTRGTRPDFPFPGAWMYANESAIVHLVGMSGDAGCGSESNLKLEHFAFSANDHESFVAKLVNLDEQYKSGNIAAFNLVQINLWDPDGNHIHVDFPANEKPPI